MGVFYSTDGTTQITQAGSNILLTSSFVTRARTASGLSLTKTVVDNLRVLFRANGTGVGQASKVQVSASQYDITFRAAAGRRIFLVD